MKHLRTLNKTYVLILLEIGFDLMAMGMASDTEMTRALALYNINAFIDCIVQIIIR